ncbi:MAG: Smr/MutS family protein [Bacillota bacterium]
MTIDLDVHGMVVEEAIAHIEKTIKKAPKDVKAIRVIHGYHGGNALKRAIQDPNRIRSKRLVRRKYTLNQGETILEID